MEKNGRILLTKQEQESFESTGKIPPRIRESWDIKSPEELEAHLSSGFAAVIDNTKPEGDTP